MLNAILIFFVYCMMPLHPLHVSITNIDYDKDKQIVDVAIKLFPSDIEAAIFKNSGVNLLLNSENEYFNSDSLINEYISNNFKLSFDGKTIKKMKYIKREKKQDALWFYFSFGNINCNTVEIENTLLFDIFNDQKNLVIINYGGNEKGFTFEKDNSVIKIALDNE